MFQTAENELGRDGRPFLLARIPAEVQGRAGGDA
jgi:hypothetical protein